MVADCISGLMVVGIRVAGGTTKSMARVNTTGQMAVSSKAPGIKTKYTAEACTLGRTVAVIMGSISRRKSKASASLFGLMASVTRASGLTANSMEKESLPIAEAAPRRDSGPMASDYSGLMTRCRAVTAVTRCLSAFSQGSQSSDF